MGPLLRLFDTWCTGLRRVSLMMGLAAVPWLHAETAKAVEWPPVPATVWNRSGGDEASQVGARILHYRIELGRTKVTHTWRIRVLSEQGKAAATFNRLPPGTTDIHGRTVHPNGEIQTFKNELDILTRANVKVRDKELVTTSVVPPGLDGDCVVDITWSEPVFLPIEAQWTGLEANRSWQLGARFPVDEVEIRILKEFPRQWVLLDAQPFSLRRTDQPEGPALTIKGLPAFEEVPYSLDSLRKLPRLLTFSVPHVLKNELRQPLEKFWSKAGAELFSWYLKGKDWPLDPHFNQLKTETVQDLPGGPQARALGILQRLRKKLKILSYPTWEESQVPVPPYSAGWHRGSEEELSRIREVKEDSFDWLFFRILVKEKIPLKLVKVRKVSNGVFSPNIYDLEQFDWTLMVIPEEGKPDLWLSPGYLLIAPGQVPPHFQGTLGEELDFSTWRLKLVEIPSADAAENRTDADLRIDIQGPDQASFRSRWSMYAGSAFDWRLALWSMDPADQERWVREQLQGQHRRVGRIEAKVESIFDPSAPLGVLVTGKMPVSSGTCSEVNPFPVIPPFFHRPEYLDQARQVPLYYGLKRSVKLRSEIKLPPAAAVIPGSPIDWENGIGKIRWESKLGTSPETVVVTMRAELVAMSASAADLQSLREFLAILNEAWLRRVRWETGP